MKRKITYNLQFSPLNFDPPFQEIEFKEFNSLAGFILADTEPGSVWLVHAGGEVFISEEIAKIVRYLQGTAFIPESELSLFNEMGIITLPENEVREIYLQEYSSYEEAFDVALTMKEGETDKAYIL